MSAVPWILGFLLAVAVIARLPGGAMLLKPLEILFGDSTRWLTSNSGNFLVYLLKAFVRCHLVIAHHLTHPEEHYDLELRAKREAERV